MFLKKFIMWQSMPQIIKQLKIFMSKSWALKFFAKIIVPKNDIKLDLKLGSQELEIFISDQFPARPSYPEALGLRHLAFKVEHIEEVIAFK